MNKIFNGLKITVHHQAWILERTFLLTTHITTHINDLLDCTCLYIVKLQI